MSEIKLNENELQFIRDAITEKYENIMKQFIFNPPPTWEEVKDIAEHEFDKELEKVTGKKTIYKWKGKKNPAPHGFKKDGTPKKKPGRKTA